MIKPFQLLWELIEFGLQALFLYGLAIILCIGLIAYAIANSKKETPQQHEPYSTPIEYGEKATEEKVKGMPVERQCVRIDGCKINNGTVEW